MNFVYNRPVKGGLKTITTRALAYYLEILKREKIFTSSSSSESWDPDTETKGMSVGLSGLAFRCLLWDLRSSSTSIAFTVNSLKTKLSVKNTHTSNTKNHESNSFEIRRRQKWRRLTKWCRRYEDNTSSVPNDRVRCFRRHARCNLLCLRRDPWWRRPSSDWPRRCRPSAVDRSSRKIYLVCGGTTWKEISDN